MSRFDRHVSESSDHSLLRRFRSGEPDAATELYVRYAQRLQSLAKSQTSHQLSSRFDPEDVVQSVFSHVLSASVRRTLQRASR